MFSLPCLTTFLSLPLTPGYTVEGVCSLLYDRDNARLVSFVNPQSWAVARARPDYAAVLARMDAVLPDGAGVAFAYRMLRHAPCERISFDMSSLAGPFFNRAGQLGRTVMLIGGAPGVAERAALRLKENVPLLRIAGTNDGFKPFGVLVADVLAKAPDVAVVGMGAPQQELFLLALREAGFKGLAITCGGFFDQYLKAERYYPAWADRLNVRFAWRLYKEPRRLWRRYLVDYQVFLRRVAAAALGLSGTE